MVFHALAVDWHISEGVRHQAGCFDWILDHNALLHERTETAGFTGDEGVDNISKFYAEAQCTCVPGKGLCRHKWSLHAVLKSPRHASASILALRMAKRHREHLPHPSVQLAKAVAPGTDTRDGRAPISA